MRRRLALAAALTCGLLLPYFCSADDTQLPAGAVQLFNGTNFDGWRKYIPPNSGTTPDKVFKVEDGTIRIDGGVPGYLITDKGYENYELHLEWKWGDKVSSGRNSGVFVHVSGPDKIWPKGVEAQLMADRAGDFWLVDGFKLRVDPKLQDPKSARHFLHLKDNVEKKLGEWNNYDITCRGDTVRLVVNGEFQNEGTEAEATKGKILIQSEGAEIFVRNIYLKPLK